MYDWPERRAEIDAEWVQIRDAMRARSVDAPETLTRRNGDMPAVPGGIRDEQDNLIAPDPAMLPPDEFDLPTLWRHPALLYGQTCWGPMELGLAPHVSVIGAPDYGEIEGCHDSLYSSAIVMRPADSQSADIFVSRIRGKRFAFNSVDSMSGYLSFARYLEKAGETWDIIGARIETGSHRASIQAVAAGKADVAAIDARSWHLAKIYEPAALQLTVVRWTDLHPGLPFIAARGLAATARKGLGLDA
jgi:ABC-type phosphate/phosphonate transport system substrate-binding protein